MLKELQSLLGRPNYICIIFIDFVTFGYGSGAFTVPFCEIEFRVEGRFSAVG